jgi:hypothetical protein
MNTAQWILFVLKLLLDYGPALVKFAKEVYELVEDISHRIGTAKAAKEPGSTTPIVARGLSAERKAEMFDSNIKPKWLELKGATPSPLELASFRQKIWVSKNKAKVMKMDSRQLAQTLRGHHA